MWNYNCLNVWIPPSPSTENDLTARRFSKKLQEGDVNEAVKLLSTSNTIVKPSKDSLEALCLKHPTRRAEVAYPELPTEQYHIPDVTNAES